jgi:hypothetical protein
MASNAGGISGLDMNVSRTSRVAFQSPPVAERQFSRSGLGVTSIHRELGVHQIQFAGADNVAAAVVPRAVREAIVEDYGRS